MAQKLLRILVPLGRDLLLQQANLTCDLGDQFCFPARDRGDDRVRQAERRGGVQPAALHPCRYRFGLAQRGLQGHL
jgi:hypothetical protein